MLQESYKDVVKNPKKKKKKLVESWRFLIKSDSLKQYSSLPNWTFDYCVSSLRYSYLQQISCVYYRELIAIQ